MITILTPTYNREYTLTRLFKSLSEQTDLRFEWLVIDDGSTDKSQNLLQTLAGEASFNIRYIYQINSGKHVAINTGCQLARGEWIFILDSDDALTADAIFTANKIIEKNLDLGILGICFRKSYFDGRIIGETKFFESELYLHPTEAGALLKGDLAYIFRRSSLQLHPFPVFRNEKFVPELYIWNKIGDDGRILYITNCVIYLCEYLFDGYSQNFSKNLKCNPQGFSIFYRSQFLREKLFIQKIKCMVRSLQCLWYSLINKLRS